MCQVDYTSEKHSVVYSKMVNSHKVEISDLLPFTIYNVNVSAVTNNTKTLTGPSCYVRTRTAIGGIEENGT